MINYLTEKLYYISTENGLMYYRRAYFIAYPILPIIILLFLVQ